MRDDDRAELQARGEQIIALDRIKAVAQRRAFHDATVWYQLRALDVPWPLAAAIVIARAATDHIG